MRIRSLFSKFLLLCTSLGIIGILAGTFAFVTAYPQLPPVNALTDYKPKLPLRIYSRDGTLIGEFGREHREFIGIDSVPNSLKNAIVAAEDEHFWEHHGIDFIGIGRAAIANVSARGVRQGASTITMQVARNFFLSSEKTFTRKFNEALLAIKIERNLTKNQILELYINQIYLGQRSYGFAAASKIYFGKPLAQASLAEVSMLAGLPKAPSKYNPVVNLKRAKQRQGYVLNRMYSLGFISEQELEQTKNVILKLSSVRKNPSRHAEFFVEMVRQALTERYGDEAYTKGLNVHTTLLVTNQEAGFLALKKGLELHDERQGYRGPLGTIDLPAKIDDEWLEDSLQDLDPYEDLSPAVVLSIKSGAIEAYVKGTGPVVMMNEQVVYGGTDLTIGSELLTPLKNGALIYVRKTSKKDWVLSQLPIAEGAVISIDADTGAINALVGGYNFYRNKFNHVTQAKRQPGSSFKPFIYSAALERGFTPGTIIDDAPFEIHESQTGFEVWNPQNYDQEFAGPISLRYALAKSKNLVAIRILQAITPDYARNYLTRFGFNPKHHPPYLTMALGAGSTTPLEMARGYAVFANGGYLVEPFFISHIEDIEGNLIFKTKSQRKRTTADQMLDTRNVFTMGSLLRNVIQTGTGIRAKSLGRKDLAGKTGTTNDNIDAWFAGFQRRVVAITWVGKDQPGPLGDKETGSRAALPIWIDYMKTALKGIPEEKPPGRPEGIQQILIDPKTGLPNEEGVVEYFYEENAPRTDSGAMF
ncbi:penicillin-binding protein 1A [Burkholderiales bacterium]|nr:penicillin-binding protein 1A [Burkholderiales bacterium]